MELGADSYQTPFSAIVTGLCLGNARPGQVSVFIMLLEMLKLLYTADSLYACIHFLRLVKPARLELFYCVIIVVEIRICNDAFVLVKWTWS